MVKPKKTKTISKQKKASSSATSRQGRMPSGQTINVFEGYSYLKEGVALTNKIFKHIENRYIKCVPTSDKQFENMVQKVTDLQNAAEKEAQDSKQTNEEVFASKGSFYNLLDYFLQSLNQLPKEEQGNNISVGNENWNRCFAQNNLRIPSNIMDIIVEKEFSNIQVFALMILHLYSMSNEDIAIDIILIFKACFESSTEDKPNVELIEIIEQYVTYFLEKITFIELNLDKKQADTLQDYRQQIKKLLAYLTQCLKEQLSNK